MVISGEHKNHSAEEALRVRQTLVVVRCHVANELRDEDGVDRPAHEQEVDDGGQGVGDRVGVSEDSTAHGGESALFFSRPVSRDVMVPAAITELERRADRLSDGRLVMLLPAVPP